MSTGVRPAKPGPKQPRDEASFLTPARTRDASTRIVVAVLVCGALFDLAVRSGVVGVGGAITIGFASLVLIFVGDLRNPQARGVVAAAPLFGTWLALRASPSLLALDIAAATALLVIGASLGNGGSLRDLSVPEIFGRALQAIRHVPRAPGFLASASRPSSHGHTLAVARAIVIALPVVVVLGALLASADAVFASFIRFEPASVLRHAALIVLGALGVATLMLVATLRHTAMPTIDIRRIGSFECTFVLIGINLLFAAFAVARLIAATEGGRRVIRTAGLTYADYARSGFFQLLAVAALTVGVLLALRATADLGAGAPRRLFARLAVATVVLTLVIVASAFQRLVLYERAYGLTLLRFYAHLAVIWIGIVVVFVGFAVARNERAGRSAPWLVAQCFGAGLALLLAANIANPDALIARHNLGNADRTARFDPYYLTELGDDAIPALVEHLDRVDKVMKHRVKNGVCSRGDATAWTGWASHNLSREAAADARQQLCDARN